MENDKNLNIFAKRLKERRKVLGLTQEALVAKANEVGESDGVKIGKSQIGRYELLEANDNKGFPTFSTGICLAKALNCSLDWLYGLSDIDIFNSEYSETESVEVMLLKMLRATLEDEITDLSIEVSDKTVIIIDNSVFEGFTAEYKDAIDFEESAIEKFGSNSTFANKATEFKKEILIKYVQKFTEMKKDNQQGE